MEPGKRGKGLALASWQAPGAVVSCRFCVALSSGFRHTALSASIYVRISQGHLDISGPRRALPFISDHTLFSVVSQARLPSSRSSAPHVHSPTVAGPPSIVSRNQQQSTIAQPSVGCTFGAIPLPLAVLVIVTVEQPYADTHKWISNAVLNLSTFVTTMSPVSPGTAHAQSYEEAENGATHAMDYSPDSSSTCHHNALHTIYLAPCVIRRALARVLVRDLARAP